MKAFVDVCDEPLHREVYKNEFLRLYRAMLEPGTGTEFHRHSKDTIYLVLRGGMVSSEKMEGTASCPTILAKSLSIKSRLSLLIQKVFTGKLYLGRGFVFYMPSKKKPVIHKAKASNGNDGIMDLLGIEILFTIPEKKRSTSSFGSVELETDAIVVRRFKIKAFQAVEGEKIEKVLIVVVSGKVEIKEVGEPVVLKAGDFYWVDSGIIPKIENHDLEQAEILYVQLKT